MKKLISICFLTFFVFAVNAQINNKTKISELNQDQLSLALEKSLKTINKGEFLTFVGLGLGVTGGVVLLDDSNKRRSSTGFLSGLPTAETGAGILLLSGAVITELIGITTWSTGSRRKKNIEIELLKYKVKESVSVNGIGLKIRF